jgi:hypothetical protein
MGKNQYPGSGIHIQDQQHWLQLARTDIRKQSFAERVVERAVEKWNRLPEMGQGRGET